MSRWWAFWRNNGTIAVLGALVGMVEDHWRAWRRS